MLFISYVFLSIQSSRLFRYYQSRQQRLMIYLLLAQSFQQLSLAISINSFKYPFSSLRLLTSFSRRSPLFFQMVHWLESSEFSQILNCRVCFLSASQFLIKERALSNCLFFILCFSSQSTISKFRCSSDSLQLFISLSNCCTSCKLVLNQFSPTSRLLTFSDNRSKSMLLMGEKSSSLLVQEGEAVSKQMG